MVTHQTHGKEKRYAEIGTSMEIWVDTKRVQTRKLALTEFSFLFFFFLILQ